MADPRERTQGDAPPVIEAAGLSCRYGDHLALDGLDLTVDAGEIVCLLGANGAGKTTTIQLFLGFLRPSAGAARIGGVDVAARPDESRRRSAYIPEQVALYDELSGLENLEYFTALGGRGPRPRAELARILVEIGLRARFIPLALGGRRLAPDDYARLPPFTFREEPLRALALRVVLSLVGIAAPTLALALFSAARLRRSRLIAPPA